MHFMGLLATKLGSDVAVHGGTRNAGLHARASQLLQQVGACQSVTTTLHPAQSLGNSHQGQDVLQCLILCKWVAAAGTTTSTAVLGAANGGQLVEKVQVLLCSELQELLLYSGGILSCCLLLPLLSHRM